MNLLINMGQLLCKESLNRINLYKEEEITMGERFPNVDWRCDRCNAFLNGQSGFDDHKYIWKCTECGHKNSISAVNVYESEEDYRNKNNW